jgi:hypothetical protein
MSEAGHERTLESRPPRVRFAPDSGHVAASRRTAGPGQDQTSLLLFEHAETEVERRAWTANRSSVYHMPQINSANHESDRA